MIDEICSVCKGESDVLVDLALQIRDAKTLREIKLALIRLSKEIESADSEERKIYCHLINLLLDRLSKLSIENVNDLKPLVEILQPTIALRLPIKTQLVASQLYSNQAYREFIELCDATGQKYHNYSRAKIALISYPDSIAYFPSTAWEDWTARLYNLYRSNQTIAVDSSRDACIVAQAVAENSLDVNELRNWVARGLSLAQRSDVDLRSVLMDGLERLGANADRTLLEIIDAVRFGNRQLPDIAKEASPTLANELRNAKFAFDVSSGNLNLNDVTTRTDKTFFESRFRQNIQGILATPAMMAIGERLEHRGIHIVAVRFYEWAKEKAHKEDKRLFALLRLRSLELKEGAINSQERRELGIGPVDDVNIAISNARNKAWERIYKYSLSVYAKQPEPEQVPVPMDESSSSAKDEPKSNLEPSSDISVNTNKPQSVFTCTIEGFDIRYNFGRKRLTVNYHDDPDIRLSIKDGTISADEMTIDEEGRISADGNPTNLALKRLDHEIRIIVLAADGLPSGIYISFQA
ncbi:MAG: hypothetical protein K2M06_07795 [Muribaculaceae bacterium]|nr:hypothetical protein [Muribaculaceae bacterium]